MWFEIYGNEEAWWWRLKSRNGRIVADGAEAYLSKSGCRRAVDRLCEALNVDGEVDIRYVG